MNQYAGILFQKLKSHVDANTAELAERLVTTCAVGRSTREVQNIVEAQIREALKLQVWCFLGLFDNAGCTLPDGVLGYKILASPEVGRGGNLKHGRPVDTRDGEHDYSDMWLAFCSETKQKETDAT